MNPKYSTRKKAINVQQLAQTPQEQGRGVFVLFNISISCVTEESHSHTEASMKVQTQQNHNQELKQFQCQISSQVTASM
jgi:hypothetical protein